MPGSYLSNFAAPISLFPYNKSISAAWLKDNPGKTIGSFGPPTYGAVQIILQGIKATCADNHGVIPQRHDVIRHIKKVKIKNFILGGNFALLDEDERPAEPWVLHLPDPVERFVQAHPVPELRINCGRTARLTGRPPAR